MEAVSRRPVHILGGMMNGVEAPELYAVKLAMCPVQQEIRDQEIKRSLPPEAQLSGIPAATGLSYTAYSNSIRGPKNTDFDGYSAIASSASLSTRSNRGPASNPAKKPL